MGVAGRYASLDAIRGLAALGVVGFHYNFVSGGAAPFRMLLEPVYESGHYFVDLFFVLSGYLLATVYAGQQAFLKLSWRRMARLVPLHWATLFLVLGLRVAMGDAGLGLPDQNGDLYHFVLNLLLLNNVGLQHGFSFNTPSWSISVEWIVNLILFALLATRVKRLLWPALALVVVAAGLLLHFRGALASVGLLAGFLDANLVRGVVGFFMGVALASLRPIPGSNHRARFGWDLVFVSATVAIACCMASERFRSVVGLDFLYVLVMMPALIVSSLRGHLVPRLLAWPPLRLLGEISYSVYLLHFPMLLLLLLALAWSGITLPRGSIAQMLLYLCATLGISYLSWRYFEKPAQAWLNARFAVRAPALEPVQE